MRRYLTVENGMFSGRELFALILPLVIEQFLAVMVGMADTVMVTATGENAVSAVSLVDTINILLIQVFSAMGAGGSIIAAQYLGHKDGARACGAAKQLLLTTLFISLMIAVPSALFSGSILRFLYSGLDADIMVQAEKYFVLSALSYPFLGLYNGGVGLLRAMGNSKTSMLSSLMMNCINIGGNWVLIYGFHMGVVGAGIASLVSRAVSAGIILCILCRRELPIHLVEPLKWHLDFDVIRRIMKVGVPNGLENSLFQVGKLLISQIIAFLPASMIAANAIVNSISSVDNIPGGAIGLAAITVVGQCMGAGDEKQARAYGNVMLRLMYLSIIPTNLVMLLFPETLVGIFAISKEGAAAAVVIMRIYAVMSILSWAPSFGLPNILRAAGDAKYTMTVSMLSMLILRLGASYLLVYAFNLGLLGVWIAMHMDWLARSVCFIKRYVGKSWMQHKLI